MSRKIPIISTAVVFILTAFLISLGIWQLQRADWKASLIAKLEAAPSQPLLEPGDFYEAMIGLKSVQYRRAQHICRPGTVRPYDLKGGSSAGGQGGFLVLVNCNPDNPNPDLVVVAGWTRSPDAMRASYTIDTMFEGLIIEGPYGDAPDRPQFMLIPTSAAPGLARSRLPSAADLPDNHLAYAGQWFGFAITLLIIYALLLRRRAKLAQPSAPR
jgi:surfeit locus 1 family protein